MIDPNSLEYSDEIDANLGKRMVIRYQRKVIKNDWSSKQRITCCYREVPES